MSQQTLIESELFPCKIVEDKGDDGRMRIAGIYQLADVKNRNSRVYPRGLWEKILSENSDFNRRLSSRLVLGELGHPADGKTTLRNVSHLVTRVWMEDKYNPECIVCKSNGGPHTHVMAEEEVLNTPEGQILKELYRAGVQIGVSSRGQGSVRGGQSEQIVADDYRLETFDHVLDPSTPGAFPRVISESVVNAVEKLINPECNPAELQGYRNILHEMRNTEDPTVMENARKLIEAIDVRLASGERRSERVYAEMPRVTYVNTNTVPPFNGSVQNDLEETTMPEISMDNPEIRNLINREVGKVSRELEHKFAAALAENDTLRAEKTEIESRFNESKRLGDELVSQLKNANFKLEGYKNYMSQADEIVESASGPEMYDEVHTVSEALDAAKAIIEELLTRLDGIHEAYARAEAAESLLAETIVRERRKGVIDEVRRVLTNESDERANAIGPMLVECATADEVRSKYKTLRRLTEGVEPKAPKARKEIKTALPSGPQSLSEENTQSWTAKAGSLSESTSAEQDMARRMMRRMRTVA